MDNNIGEARRAYAERIGGFTQEDAAEYFEVALSTYKKWEQGQGKMNGAQLRAIAEKYGVTTDYLLQRAPLPRPIAAKAYENPYEQELIALFRSMDSHGQEQLLIFARGCAASYPKNKASEMGA